MHGHTVGGTNPSLLEALSSTDLNLLVDVGFNREVGMDTALYWDKKEGMLADLINKVDNMDYREINDLGIAAKHRIIKSYNWEKIVENYEHLFLTDMEMINLSFA